MQVADYVFHKSYGIGKVKSFSPKRISVEFKIGEKRFVTSESYNYLTPLIDNEFAVSEGELIAYVGKSASVVLPQGVSKIGRRAFADNDAITSVNLGSQVSEINDEAFDNCKKLVSVRNTSGLKHVGSRAFQNCRNLTEIIIPPCIEEIEGAAFNGCRALKTIHIPDRIRQIEFETFQGCLELESVTGMKGVKSIGNDAFLGCLKLELVLPEGLESIERRAFFYCSALYPIYIPRSVTVISNEAFFCGTESVSISGYPKSFAERYARNHDYEFFDCTRKLPAEEKKSNKIKKSVPSKDPVKETVRTPANVAPQKKEKKKSGFLMFVLAILILAGAGFCVFYDQVLNIAQMEITGEVRTNGAIYTGDLEWGVIHGTGMMTFADGSSYSGEWFENLISGNGTFRYSDGSYYEGSFLEGLRNGDGVYVWENGDTFSGEWADDMPHGSGELLLKSGDSYEGEFRYGQFVEGTYTQLKNGYTTSLTIIPDGDNVFKIVFNDGTCIEGITAGGMFDCTVSYNTGDTYTGVISDGERNGYGVYKWASGDEYVGYWTDDSMNGEGTLLLTNGNSYEGSFSANQFIEGTATFFAEKAEFIYSCADGEFDEKLTVRLKDGTEYVGTYEGNKLTGIGEVEYSDGDVYTGEVYEGSKCGDGIYTWADGDWYEGEWREDKMNGSGTYYFDSGTTHRLKGQFRYNVPNGICYYYTAAGDKYITNWINGDMVSIYAG